MNESKKLIFKQLLDEQTKLIATTKAGITYTISSAIVFDDCVTFKDRDGVSVVLDWDTIAVIREVKE